MARYSAIAAFWHWLSAALVIGQFYSGYMFHKVFERGTPERAEMFGWHATLGYLLLVVALLRVATRLVKPAPPLPTALPERERVLAKISHMAIYAFIVLLPLGGILAISDRGTAELANGVTLPVIPGISESLSDLAGEMHGTFVWVFAALLAVHVAAAFYHQLRITPAAGRMWPFKRGPR